MERSTSDKGSVPRKRGAPKGNKNAVGGRGNPNAKPPDATKHGGYSAVYWDTLDEDEKNLIEDMPKDEEELLIEQIQLFSVRERRIMKAINKYRNSESPVALAFSQRSERKRAFENDEDKEEYARRIAEKVADGERLPGNEYSVFTQTDNKDQIIARLESELSNVQSKKTKAIEALSKMHIEHQKLDGGNKGTDAKISFVSLVDKAANKKQFLITKSEDGAANFATFGRILKADADSHFVTGIVYEPMVEDTQGNYMTEEEITKAAYWFAKNGNQVDLQHCFKKCDGAEVVESYVAKCDMEIEGETIKKGTWLMTMEITDADVWDSIQKGDITGFSMGGVGVYSEEDVELPVEKQEEPKGLFRKLAKAMGFDVVEKGAVKNNFKRRVKEDNFYSAWYALRSCLEGNFYNPDTGSWEWGYNSDEETIKDALTDFNDIVTQLLTSDGSIVKSLEKAAKEAPAPVEKAGKSISTKNLSALKGIYDTLGSFLSEFTDNSEGEGGDTVAKNNVKKEDDEMKREEVQQMVGDAVAKAMEPITKQLEAITKGEGGEGEGTPAEPESDVNADEVAKMVGEAVSKAMEPVTKAIEPLLKSRALPGNLNSAAGTVEKQEAEPHYMTGMF